MRCNLIKQGYPQGSCFVEAGGGTFLACEATLKESDRGLLRLISAAHLSRPENYLSIYQSGCNFSCRKCHSWAFTKRAKGEWWSPADVLKACKEYEKGVTIREPRKRATAFHASESCRCCGACVMQGKRSPLCPRVIQKKDIVLSPQGWGPARDIVAFTGGDLTCCPDFYIECARLIKSETSLKILIETNGYGLTPQNLDALKEAGVDSFWLDIKAYDGTDHKWLTGCFNRHILKLPEEIVKRGFVLEVLSLYIPNLAETPQLKKIARLLFDINPEIPFTILAFFPEHQMKRYRSPKVTEMISAYHEVKAVGLVNVRLGNIGIFASSEEDHQLLKEKVGMGNY
ncbi:MAG: radical SAM protein [Deltaproteobacteria bacterium RBG_16_49_23]|nr:MAG: radical SAM protein [Deltaproteobacteria bacterium RBG_16_49_23]OGQ11230.1 MAG: radical SAM protein [Deltaproteobacteria bacterium RBG_19FT_COMBO_46_12]